MSRRLRWLPVLLAVIALMAGCTVGPSTRPALATYGEQPAPISIKPATPARPIGPGGKGRSAEPLNWSSCPSGVSDPSKKGITFSLDCADLAVPLTYTGSDPSTLDLQVARARAANTPKNAPNLVVVLGRPGVNGPDQIADIAGSMPAALLATHSIVTLDLRGTAAEMACFSRQTIIDLLSPPIDPAQNGNGDTLGTFAQEASFDCEQRVGASISEFSSTAAADDLDSLRSALGTDKLQFLGQGFGATLGAVYADRYPGRVDRLVLDGPSDPSATLSDAATSRAVELEKALDDFAAECSNAAGGCPLGAHPRTAITTLINTLGDDGIGDQGLLITGGSVLLLLSQLLGDPSSWPNMYKALAAANGGQGDTDPLVNLLLSTFGLGDSAVDSHLMESRMAYACNDSSQRLSGTALVTASNAAKKAAPTFGAFMVGQASLCSSWPPATSALARLTAKGAPSIFVAGAVDDPDAPYAGVKAVVSQLTSASLISWQSGTHGAFPASRCISTAVLAYLAKDTAPATDALCPP
ncbi:MAG: alpha/beta hydrolase [Actinomycetota bacterium]|nr:alpha/beta hydrolase [Actinomycetota bacterium]